MKPLLTSTNDGHAFKKFLQNCRFEVPPEQHLEDQSDPAVIKAAFDRLSKTLEENNTKGKFAFQKESEGNPA